MVKAGWLPPFHAGISENAERLRRLLLTWYVNPQRYRWFRVAEWKVPFKAFSCDAVVCDVKESSCQGQNHFHILSMEFLGAISVFWCLLAFELNGILFYDHRMYVCGKCMKQVTVVEPLKQGSLCLNSLRISLVPFDRSRHSNQRSRH